MNEFQKKWSERINRCTFLGLQYDAPAQSYVLEDFNVAVVDIKVMSDEEFDKMMVKIAEEMHRRKTL